MNEHLLEYYDSAKPVIRGLWCCQQYLKMQGRRLVNCPLSSLLLILALHQT